MCYGGDANAYTDFRNTVYQLNAPLKKSEVSKNYAEKENTEQAQKNTLWKVLDVLKELVFNATIDQANVDRERSVVLSELRISNDISYRSTVAYYNQIYANSLISKRIPIGKEEQILSFSAADLRKFYDDFYHPARMHLFIVGQLNIQQAENYIQQIFYSEEISARFNHLASIPRPLDAPSTFPVAITDAENAIRFVDPLESLEINKEDYNRSPEVIFDIFEHHLQVQFLLLITLLSPFEVTTKIEELRIEVILDIISQIITSRFDIFKRSQPKITINEADWSYSADWSEGCTKNTYWIESAVDHWEEAVFRSVFEINRLIKHGISHAELEFCTAMVLKQLEQAFEQSETTDSSELVEDLVGSYNTGCLIIDIKERYRYIKSIVTTITVQEIELNIKKYLSFITDFINYENNSKMNKHLSISVSIPPQISSQIKLEKIIEIMKNAVDKIEIFEFPTIPEFLINQNDFEKLKIQTQERNTSSEPIFIPVNIENNLLKNSATKKKKSKKNKKKKSKKNQFPTSNIPRFVDENSKIILMQLSNGIKLTLKKTTYESKQCNFSIIHKGGKMCELSKDLRNATSIGLTTMLYGDVDRYSSAQIASYCNIHGIDISHFSNISFFGWGVRVSVTDSGIRRGLELCHLFLSCVNFDEKAFERKKIILKNEQKKAEKDIEWISYHNVGPLFFDSEQDLRFVSSHFDNIDKLSLSGVHSYLKPFLVPSNTEIIIVGDFEWDEIESNILTFLGSLPACHVSEDAIIPPEASRVTFSKLSRRIECHISDDQARTYITIPVRCLNYRGESGDIKPLPLVIPDSLSASERATLLEKRGHPLYPYRVQNILEQVFTPLLFI